MPDFPATLPKAQHRYQPIADVGTWTRVQMYAQWVTRDELLRDRLMGIRYRAWMHAEITTIEKTAIKKYGLHPRMLR